MRRCILLKRPKRGLSLHHEVLLPFATSLPLFAFFPSKFGSSFPSLALAPGCGTLGSRHRSADPDDLLIRLGLFVLLQDHFNLRRYRQCNFIELAGIRGRRVRRPVCHCCPGLPAGGARPAPSPQAPPEETRRAKGVRAAVQLGRKLDHLTAYAADMTWGKSPDGLSPFQQAV